MIPTGHTTPVAQQALAWAEAEHFSWTRPDFGGHVYEAAYVDAEAPEVDR